MTANPTVLIVEDEALVLEVAALEFADAGYEVLTATNGAAAIGVLDDRPIDLLFTDIRMPGLVDGWELARRARDRHPHLAVIYATGYSDEPPATVPNSKLLSKPYSLSEVIATAAALRSSMGRAAGRADP